MDASFPVRLAANFQYTRKMRNEDSKHDWWQFNNSFENIEVASPEQLSEIVAKGHSICAQHRRVHHPQKKNDGTIGQTAYRHHLNWLPTSVAILDFDSGDIGPKDVFDNEFVATYGWMTYTTTSHTPEHPRFRLIFALPKPVQSLDNFSSLLQALAWRFGSADRASKNPVQAYAGNCGQNYDRVLHGQYLSVAAARELIEEHKAFIAEQASSRSFLQDSGQAPPDVVEIREMLRYIPTKMDYMEWFLVLAAVRNAVDDHAIAVDLCEEWSPGTEGEIDYKMKHMQLGQSGAGHLLKLAYRGGYRSPEQRERQEINFMKSALRGGKHSGGRRGSWS